MIAPAAIISGSRTSATRIPALDTVRGLAVLLVLANHFVALNPTLIGPAGDWRNYVRAALLLPTASGVDLFFVLSGFLVGGILLDHRESPRVLPVFFLRRFLRIMPLAWLCVAVSWLSRAAAITPDIDAPVGWWPYLTFTVNFHLAAHNGWWHSPLVAFWSLAIEEQFYLVFPWVVRAWPARHLAWIGPVLIGVAWISRAAVLLAAPDHRFACAMLMPCRLDAFGFGLVAAWLIRPAGRALWLRVRPHRWNLLALAAIGPAWLVAVHAGPTDLAYATWGLTSVAFFGAVLLLLACDPPARWCERIFASPILQCYGKYSYFVYLFQGLASIFLGLALRPWSHLSFVAWIPALVVPAAILVPAWLSGKFFEQPLLRIGQRFAY